MDTVTFSMLLDFTFIPSTTFISLSTSLPNTSCLFAFSSLILWTTPFNSSTDSFSCAFLVPTLSTKSLPNFSNVFSTVGPLKLSFIPSTTSFSTSINSLSPKLLAPTSPAISSPHFPRISSIRVSICELLLLVFMNCWTCFNLGRIILTAPSIVIFAPLFWLSCEGPSFSNCFIRFSISEKSPHKVCKESISSGLSFSS